MQDGFAQHLVDLLQVGDPSDPAVATEAGERGHAMLVTAMAVLCPQVGAAGALRLAVEGIENALRLADGSSEPAPSAPLVGRFAELLLDMLRMRDAVNPMDAGAAHNEACALVLAGAVFLQERHGSFHMGEYLSSIAIIIQDKAAAGIHPLSAPKVEAPMLPPPPSVAMPVRPRADLPVPDRANMMGSFLRGEKEEDAKADALASIAAAIGFLRERYGEEYAFDTLQRAETSLRRSTMLDHWHPPEGNRPN